MGTQRVQMKGALPWSVIWARCAGTRDFDILPWLLWSAQYKICFLTAHFLNVCVPPSSINLGRPSCRAACLWMCVSPTVTVFGFAYFGSVEPLTGLQWNRVVERAASSCWNRCPGDLINRGTASSICSALKSTDIRDILDIFRHAQKLESVWTFQNFTQIIPVCKGYLGSRPKIWYLGLKIAIF